MAGTATQRAAFRFLREHLHSQDVFTLDEFQTAAGWENTRTFDTYRRKQFKGLIEKVDDTHYRVTDAFWRLATLSRSTVFLDT